MATALYSVLHFLVDLVCAWAMFNRFIPGIDGYTAILIYNFCAFALQMPLGALLDRIPHRHARYFAALGICLTLSGAFLHPAILGLGNALFHVGGGVEVIHEDNATGRKGAALGIFVAPGALGLFLGGLLKCSIFPLFPFLILLTVPLFFLNESQSPTQETTRKPSGLLILCCFLVVILRSYVGMAVSMPWKTGPLLPLVAVLAVVLGKMAGGIIAARFGLHKTILFSLLLAAGCYLGAEYVVPGLGALFLFNMTMPITLYDLSRNLPDHPGFSFGLLTFGLFLGFLPVYLELPVLISPQILGFAGSVLSLILLLPLWKAGESH